MKRSVKVILTLSAALWMTSITFATENAFYILRDHSSNRLTPYSASYADLTQQTKKIQLLIGQAYHIDQYGVVTGSIDQETVDFAKTHGIKLMVLVTNSLFDNERAHKLLSNDTAKKKAIQSILDLCIANHYYGVQFDFEGIKIVDRDLLTQFFKEATDALHQHGFKVSFAVIPTVSAAERTSEFLIRKYRNWSGVYDLKALGEMGEFVTLMAYDQHASGTTPGPLAGYAFDEALLQNTLQYIPSQKISLGIPSYSSYWKTSNDPNNLAAKISMSLNVIPYKDMHDLLTKSHAKLLWDSTDENYYAILEKHYLHEYAFVEDKSAFKAKMSLVKKYKLRGISLFDLGNEDPDIWKVMS